MNKIAIIKAVRTISGLGLKEAKDLVDDWSSWEATESVVLANLVKFAFSRGAAATNPDADPVTMSEAARLRDQLQATDNARRDAVLKLSMTITDLEQARKTIQNQDETVQYVSKRNEELYDRITDLNDTVESKDSLISHLQSEVERLQSRDVAFAERQTQLQTIYEGIIDRLVTKLK